MNRPFERLSRYRLIAILCVVMSFSQSYTFAQDSADGNHPQSCPSDTVTKDEVSATELPELLIDGKSASIITDGVSYVPQQKLKNVSSNAYDLLRKMQSPQLQIPKNFDDPLTFINGGAITYYINGIKARSNEEKSILSKDVERIEILASPTDPRFAGDKYVVNFVIRQYSSGGYTYLSAVQDLTLPQGSYGATSILESGRSTFVAYVNYGWLKNQKTIDGCENHYLMRDPDNNTYELIEQSSETSRTSQQSFGAVLEWKYRIKPEKSVLVINAGIDGYDNPSYMSGYSTYNLPGYDNVKYKKTLSGSDWTPYISLLYTNKFSDKDYLNLSYVYGTVIRSSHHTYEPEDRDAIVNNTKATTYSNNLRIFYKHTFNNVHSLSATLFARPDYYTAEYSGTADSRQNLIDFKAQLIATYTLSKKRWNISLKAVLGANTIKVNDEHPGTSFTPGAYVDFWVQPADRHSVYGSLSYATNTLPIKSLNTVSRVDGEFNGTKGNADLEHPHSVSAYLSYTWLASNFFSMTFTPIWNHSFNSFQNDYVSVDDVMYRYTVNGAEYDNLKLSLKAGITLFGSKFTIAPEIMVKRQQFSGISNNKLWAFQPSLSLQYIPTDHWYFGVDASMRTKNIFNYGHLWCPGEKLDITVNAAYNTKGFNCSLMIMPMPDKTSHTYRYNPIADTTSSFKRDQICPYAILSLSYNFEYGRKLSEKTSVERQFVGSSSAM